MTFRATLCASALLACGATVFNDFSMVAAAAVPKVNEAFPKGAYAALNSLPDWGGVWVLERAKPPGPGEPARERPALKGEYLAHYETWAQEVKSTNGLAHKDTSNCMPPGMPGMMGTAQYPPLARRYQVPIVVTGFEPLDILEGIRKSVTQLEEGRYEVENAYPRAVPAEGNVAAMAMLSDVFEVTDRTWRGIGMIPESGWKLSGRYADFDAEHRFDVAGIHTAESTICRSGEVLQGLIKPFECAAFGKQCTPRKPLGATMVSSEGACAAYYTYRRLDLVQTP